MWNKSYSITYIEIDIGVKPIHFVNSVCTIFIFWKRDPSHQTFPSQPELTSAVILWKQDPCAELFTQWMDFSWFFMYRYISSRLDYWSTRGAPKGSDTVVTQSNGLVGSLQLRIGLGLGWAGKPKNSLYVYFNLRENLPMFWCSFIRHHVEFFKHFPFMKLWGLCLWI